MGKARPGQQEPRGQALQARGSSRRHWAGSLPRDQRGLKQSVRVRQRRESARQAAANTSPLRSSIDGFFALSVQVCTFVLFEQLGGHSWRTRSVLHRYLQRTRWLSSREERSPCRDAGRRSSSSPPCSPPPSASPPSP